MTKRRGSWPCVLVVALTVTRARSTWECVAKSVDGLVHRHVAFFEHGFDALEVRAAGEVAAVNHGANVRPLGVHRAGRVDDEGKFTLPASGVVPRNLDVIVGVHHDVRVPFVADDGGEQGVVKERDDGARADVGLNHGIVDLRLIEEAPEFVVVVLPNDVDVVLAVDVQGRPIAVLRAS